MNARLVLAELFRLTGALFPASPATFEDLATLRRHLAESLFGLSGAGVSASVPSDPASRPVLAQLQAIVDEVTLAGVPARRSRVLRRELPLRSAHQPPSFPARSGGHAIRRTFGPMLEGNERFVFFDLFEAADLVRVDREELAAMLLLPPDAQSTDGLSFEFAAGSVWIEARLLSPGAPGFVGLRVSEGTLVTSEHAAHLGDHIVVPAQAICTLTVVLDPPALEAPPDGPGMDAGLAVATRPRQASFELGPQGAQRIEAADAALSLYGTAVNLTRTDEPAIFWEPTGGVLVPFAASERDLHPQDVRSTLLQPAGAWRVGAAGWLLPLSLFTDPEDLGWDELGDAADAGAMAIVVEDGLTAAWHGLGGDLYRAQRATISADSRELALVADGRTGRIARQELALWRDSWIELHLTSDFRLHFASSRSGAEAVVATVPATAHLDRPLQADSRRPRVRFEAATLSLSQGAGGELVGLSASRPVDPHEIVPAALSNALLKLNPAETLSLWGLLVEGSRVEGASLRLTFGLHAILPFLPDPYAADFAAPRDPVDSPARARLTAAIVWSGPEGAVLTVSIAPAGDEAVDLADALLPVGRVPPAGDPDENILRMLVDRTLGTGEPQQPLLLLDLSSNADQFGVRTAFPQDPAGRPLLRVENLGLAADAGDLRLVALPQVQWEPVRTHPSDLRPGFPQPFRSKDDGGPLVMGVVDDSVHLVPIAPAQVLEHMVAIAERETAAAAIKFTLPFGIKAVTVMAADQQPRPSIALNRPAFGPLTGGLQISVRAATPEGMPGGAIQTSNGTAGPTTVLDHIAVFFNERFHPSDMIARVPLSRIDLSGYGASTSSRWVNEDAAPLDITKVEFDMLVGRTSVEVVEAQSILWPCMARVVRRITIRREGDGTVLRRDSGWVAATPGLFQRPDCACVFHPGAVLGMFDIREIRDTPDHVPLTTNVDLQVVYFDTDIAFANVVRGHGREEEGPDGVRIGFVPAHRQLGFVQLINPDSEQTDPLTPQQLGELLSKHGPVGGPVDCELDVAGSQQRMRVGSVYSAVAPVPTGGDPQFAVAAYGAPELPREGQWSVVRMRNDPLDSPEPEPVDARLGVPLIRAGRLFTLGDPRSPFRFADPVDLLSPADPAVDYALLFATQTFRVLFPRIKIDLDSRQITSDLAPVLADALSMTTATGLFPRLKHAIPFPSNAYALQTLSSGGLRLEPTPLTHTMPPRTLDLAKAAGLHAFTEYRGGDRHQFGPAKIELLFDSDAEPSWGLKIGPVSTIANVDPFGPVMRLITTFEANSIGRPKGTKPLIEYGGALRPVEDLITVMHEFGVPADMLVETPNSPEVETTYKFKAALKIELPDSDLFGKMKGELSVGMEFGTRRTKFAPSLFPPTGEPLFLPIADPGGSMELFVEAEGKLRLPVLPLVYGGGLLRLAFIAGNDPSEHQPGKLEIKLEIKLAAAVVVSLGGDFIPKLLRVYGEFRYGYVLIIDIANAEVQPGLLLGVAVECQIKALVTLTFEAEVIGLVKRIDDATVELKAELTIAGEIELFELVSVEYTLETEWEQRLPIVAFAALALAMGIPPVIPP